MSELDRRISLKVYSQEGETDFYGDIKEPALGFDQIVWAKQESARQREYRDAKQASDGPRRVYKIRFQPVLGPLFAEVRGSVEVVDEHGQVWTVVDIRESARRRKYQYLTVVA